jgi:hypothetical protein
MMTMLPHQCQQARERSFSSKSINLAITRGWKSSVTFATFKRIAQKSSMKRRHADYSADHGLHPRKAKPDESWFGR